MKHSEGSSFGGGSSTFNHADAESFAKSWDDQQNSFGARELDKDEKKDYRPSKKDKYIEEQLYEEKLKMELESDQQGGVPGELRVGRRASQGYLNQRGSIDLQDPSLGP